VHALVHEGRGILGRMTVEDNLLMGIYFRKHRSAALADLHNMYDRFPVLHKRRTQLASFLSGGEQQLLAIARACLSKPRLMMLDEPSLGLAPKMTNQVFDMIATLRADGLTIVLVEQKARQTLKFADRAYLLETGRVVTKGYRRRKGGSSQSIEVKHVHIHAGGQGVIGIVNNDEGKRPGGDQN
jgi:branched-chain amino acid transport system ATP-binding protein